MTSSSICLAAVSGTNSPTLPDFARAVARQFVSQNLFLLINHV